MQAKGPYWGPLWGNPFLFAMLWGSEGCWTPSYDRHRLDGQLKITASTCNELDDYAVSRGTNCYTHLAISSPAVAKTVQCQCSLCLPTNEWMARLSWPGWLVTYQVGLPLPVLTGCDLKVSLLMRPRMLLILFARYAFLFPRTICQRKIMQFMCHPQSPHF